MKARNLFIIVLAVFAFGACNSTTKNEKENNGTTDVQAVDVEKSKSHDESKVVYLTDATFKEKVFNFETNEEWKYEGDVPCIIDFYADWCGPCKMIAPTLDELSKEYDGKIIIYKVDTEKHKQVSAAFGIRSIPSILFVPVEGQPQMAQGALPKESFVTAIEEVLLSEKSNS